MAQPMCTRAAEDTRNRKPSGVEAAIPLEGVAMAARGHAGSSFGAVRRPRRCVSLHPVRTPTITKRMDVQGSNTRCSISDPVPNRSRSTNRLSLSSLKSVP